MVSVYTDRYSIKITFRVSWRSFLPCRGESDLIDESCRRSLVCYISKAENLDYLLRYSYESTGG